MRSLNCGVQTFTTDRVRQVLRNDLNTGPYSRAVFYCPGMAFENKPGGMLRTFDIPQRKARAATFIREYCTSVANPQDHLSRLDSKSSELLECHFDLRRLEDEEEVVSRTCHMLCRLPETTPEFDGFPQDICRSLDERYFNSQTACSDDQVWDRLNVVSFLCTNVIRLALTIVLVDPKYTLIGVLRQFPDTISELLRSLCDDNSGHEGHSQEQVLIKAFLWSTWQRSVMLFLSYTLGQQMLMGHRPELNQDSRLQPPPLSPQQYDLGKPEYMCNWAYELLRADPAAIGGDLRRFLERYKYLFANRQARCCVNDVGLHIPCDGKAPENCGRFKGMHIEDQSTHVPSCSKDCPRLYWDEASFKNVAGARAVSINEEVTGYRLKYIATSSRTMAISHVWSHGQGGRPEYGTTGFNTCLHNRYCSIARSIGCDSYWMDTPCIPGLHENLELRREAIDKINQVFSNSKITLICDRDIMDIDISDLTLQLQESILAAFLVCDWNVRAWTLLEATRGTGNLHLLCKDDKLISVNEILKTVHAQGSMDIAILFSDAPHLLPIPPSRYKSLSDGGYVAVDRAAYLLSHRYATRKGDDVVIWSLLCNETASHSVEEFWRTQATHAVSTGFLMSSVPRLKHCPGLTWAPLRPDLQEPSRRFEGNLLLPSSRFNAFDGQGSELGILREDGLTARWLVHFIQVPLRDPIGKTVDRIMSRIKLHSRKRSTESQITKIADLYLRDHQMGALLRPKTLSRDDAFEYRGKANGPLLAVVGSDNGGSSWCWKGIYEWLEEEPLPKFEAEPILLV